MATWLELAQDNNAAARLLLDNGHFRSSVSRSYYAAYAGVTHLLADLVTFPAGRDNPTHESIPDHIKSNLPGMTVDQRRALRTDFSALFKARVEADYKPGLSCDEEIARNARLRCDGILKGIGLS